MLDSVEQEYMRAIALAERQGDDSRCHELATALGMYREVYQGWTSREGGEGDRVCA
jgi:hypothetical protein